MRTRFSREVLGTAAALLVVGTTALTAAGQGVGIGANFRGTNALAGESTFVPPDSMGAVGPDRVMLLVNGRYELYTKNPSMTGIDGDPIVGQASDLSQFWLGLGLTIENHDTGGGFAFDPRVTYDPVEKRWYAASIDGKDPVTNSVFFAVSKTSNPENGWDAFEWQGNVKNEPGSIDEDNWADFPMLGFDGENVYISTDNFNSGGSRSDQPLHILPKSDLLSANPSIDARSTHLLDQKTNQVVRAIDGLGPNSTTPQPYHLWEEEEGNASLFYNEVRGDGVGDVDLTDTEILMPVGTQPLYRPNDGRQPRDEMGDQVPGLEQYLIGDRIASRLVRVNGSYWGVYPRTSDIPGETDRNVARWFEVDATTMAIEQVGEVSAPSEMDITYPSIAVNEDGDVVIGFTASGPDAGEFASAYAIVGRTDGNGETTFPDNAILLQQGVHTYNVQSNNRNRWGDYTNTVDDPADPNIFWTFQEWASEPLPSSQPPHNDVDRWSVQVSELIVYDADEKYWAADVDGDFNDGAKWLGGVAPGAGDHALFSRTGSPFDVTLTTDPSNARLSVRQGDVNLNLGGHTYTLTDTVNPGIVVAEYQGSASLTVSQSGLIDTRGLQVGSAQSGTASFNLNDTATVIVSGDAVVHADAAINVNGGSLQSTGAITVKSNGAFNYQSGFVNADQFVIEEGGALGTTGFLNVGNADLTNHGVIELGDHTVGQSVYVDNYTQGGSGELVMSFDDFNPTSTDIVLVNHDVDLDGQLTLNPINGFVPTEADLLDEIVLMLFTGDRTGNFSSVNNNAIPGTPLYYAVDYVDSTSANDEVKAIVAYGGDINLDGRVSLTDLDIFGRTFGQPGTWREGDFNGDGQVSLVDLDIIGANFGMGSGGSAAPAVPEPASLLLLSLGALVIARRRTA